MALDECTEQICGTITNCSGQIPQKDFYTFATRLLCYIANNLSGGGGGGIPVVSCDGTDAGLVTTCAATDIASIAALEATGAGSVSASKYSVSFVNIGNANATVLGVTLAPGESRNFTGYYDQSLATFFRLPAIAYDGTGTTLHITWIN